MRAVQPYGAGVSGGLGVEMVVECNVALYGEAVGQQRRASADHDARAGQHDPGQGGSGQVHVPGKAA